MAVALTAAVSCKKETAEEFSFEVQNATGTQAFVFGQTREFPFTAVNVSRTTFEKPAGWDASLDFQAKVLKITAPSGEGDASGVIAATATSNGGQTKTVKIEVSASEAAIVFSVEGIADGISLKYGESVALKAKMENVATVEASGLKGWKAEKVSDTEVKVTAPSKSDTEAQLEGTLVLTPKSGRGTVGTPVNVKASVKVAEPSIQLDKTEISRVDLGTVTDVNTTELTNVVKLEVKSAPKGWKTDINLQKTSAKITVTAPAQGSEFEGIGEVVLLATSETETTTEASIKVSLKGINNAEDLLNCANEFAKKENGDMSPYILNGEIVLNCDVDISNNKYSSAIFRGQDFKMTFNGQNHTIKYALEASEGIIALFDTIAKEGTVKNLTVDGTINYSGDVKAAGITGWSDGGTYENINVKIAFTQTGAYEGSKGNFGGIAAAETSPAGGGHYTNCHFLGTINVQSTKYLGGMVGDVWDNSTDDEFINCSNEGTVIVNTQGTRIQDACHGGLLGNCRGANPIVKGCFNKANFTYDFGGAKADVEGVGGLVGYAAGRFTDCYNTGNITFANNNIVRGWAHVGGFIGQAKKGKDADQCLLTNCYSKCNVTAYGEDVSVFIGLLQVFAEGTVIIDKCWAEGTADCVFPLSTDNLGGFIANINDFATIKNCTFTGTVKGYVYDCAGSFLGQSGYGNSTGNSIIIQNCTSTGNLYVGSHTSSESTTRPLVAGIAVSWGPKTVITESSVKGNIFTMCPDAKCIDKVMVSKRVVDGNPEEESSTADDATVNSAKDNKITTIAKTDTWPADWK